MNLYAVWRSGSPCFGEISRSNHETIGSSGSVFEPAKERPTSSQFWSKEASVGGRLKRLGLIHLVLSDPNLIEGLGRLSLLGDEELGEFLKHWLQKPPTADPS